MTGAPLSPAVGFYLILGALIVWGLWTLLDRANREGM